jgi:hypothetical protein
MAAQHNADKYKEYVWHIIVEERKFEFANISNFHKYAGI